MMILVRLNEDMISLAESPRPVVIEGEEWEEAPEWMDKITSSSTGGSTT